ncbi:MAG: N-6 DNA methylase [Pirellulales bacterium]|nr:N-6 DNA methylase [Pirellulales bacterium]
MAQHRGKPLDAQRLVDAVGSRSTLAREAVKALLSAADEGHSPPLGDIGSLPVKAIATLARRLRLAGERPSPERLRRALETYYATVVQLVVERVLGVADVPPVLGPETMEQPGGWATAQRWPSDCPSMDRRLDRARQQLAGYDTLLSPDSPPPAVDWFGPLYQDLFPRSLRHALGEYYTPDWLAEHVLDAVGYQGQTDSRLLDPTCGSGVFLLSAIRRIRQSSGKDVPPEALGQRILENVAGYDVNPVAVLTSRANCLLAIRDLVPAGSPCPAPLVRLRDVILDPSEPDERFDFVVGNPPWVAWDNLPDDYREQTKPFWQDYGLFSLTGTQARHGGGKKDLSMLVLYRAADRHLRRGGRLGFVITQTVFQTKGAGDGFRRFQLGEQGEPLGVLRVDDLAGLKPFAGASNWTATIVLEKGREMVYPVDYVRWRECKTGACLDAMPTASVAPEEASSGHRVACLARPIDPARPRSPWIVVPERLETDLDRLAGPSDYSGNLGANSGGANGVYWVEVIEVDSTGAPPGATAGLSSSAEEPSPLSGAPLRYAPATPGTQVVIRNLAGVGRRAVEQVEATVEADLLYPLVRWGDLRRWRAVPKACVLLAQDVETRSGIDESTMRERWPRTLDYLSRFRPMLERRAAYRRYQSAGPFWSMYNVGPYTLAPTKVVWRRMDRRINAAVVEPVDDPRLGRRPVVVQETCVQVAVDTADEAHYLAAVLNSAPAGFLVAAHSVRGGKGFGTPGMLDYLNVRRFDPGDERHRRLAEQSREAHRLAAADEDPAEIQRAVDRRAAELWGLSQEELAAIEEYLGTFA